VLGPAETKVGFGGMLMMAGVVLMFGHELSHQNGARGGGGRVLDDVEIAVAASPVWGT
jgi:hypothetical protein